MYPDQFRYYDYSHREWPDLLAGIEPGRSIVIEVPWGIHQRSRGVNDFTRSPRLCLERLLALLSDRRIRVTIEIGFRQQLSLPDWIWGISQRLMVPAASVLSHNPFLACDVPDIGVGYLTEAFSEFIRDVAEIANLYRAPEGGVEAIFIEPGFYRTVWSLPNAALLERCLKRKYLDKKEFNEIFGVGFGDISGERYLTSLTMLLQRRPNVACHDLKTAHEVYLSEWLGRLSLNSVHADVLIKDEKIICGAATCDLINGFLIPYCPAGTTHIGILQSYGKLQNQYCRAQVWLSNRAPESRNSQLVLVEKSIRRELFEYLERRAASGFQVFFLPNMPIYDEKMAVIFTSPRPGQHYRIDIGVGQFCCGLDNSLEVPNEH